MITMRRIVAALALICAVPAWAAINGTAVRTGSCTAGASSTCTPDLGAEPTTGNLLVLMACRNDDQTSPTINATGFTTVQSGPSSSANALQGAIAWKVADGTAEQTVGVTWSSDNTQAHTVAYMEIASTDLNLASVEASGENEANAGSVTTSLSSGSASNTTAAALVIAGFCTDNGIDQTPSYSNSYNQQVTQTSSARAESFLATKVVASTASQTTTATISSDEGYGAILIFGASSITCPAACAGGRTAVCITSTASSADADNLLNGQSPAVVANEDTICHDATSDILADAVTVDASGWVTFASGGSILTDDFDYCIMDAGAACGTDGTYQVTQTPALSAADGLGSGQTTGTSTVTTDQSEGSVYAYVSTSATPPSSANHKSGSGATWWGRDTPEERTNLAVRSQEPNTGLWAKTRCSISAEATTAPDGTSTADKIIEDSTASNTHVLNQTLSKASSSIQYTWSAYLKAAERTYAVIAPLSGANGYKGYVNLSDCATTTIHAAGSGFSGGTITAKAAGNSWCFVTVTATTNTSSTVTFNIGPSTGTGANDYSYSGDGSSGIYVWGAQLEQASFASSYIVTAAAAATRTVRSLIPYNYIGGLAAGTTYYTHFIQVNNATTPVDSTQVTTAAWNTTAAGDTTPTAFTFTDLAGQNTDTPLPSNTITVAGIDAAAVVTASGCSWKKNSGSYGTADGTVVVTDTVQLQMQSPADNGDSASCVITIGGVSDTWTITTRESFFGLVRSLVHPIVQSLVQPLVQ